MPQPIQIMVKSSIFDRHRKLTIEKDFLEFDDKNLASAPPAFFLKKDITGLKYGVEWIRGYRFVIGRVYCIYILNRSNAIIKIRLKSVYGIRKIELHEKYSKILNAVYDNFIADISINYLNQFTEGKILVIATTRLMTQGILLKEGSDLIAWNNVGIKKYTTYYSVHSISNPEKRKIIEYLTEWEGIILYVVLQQIIKIDRMQNVNDILRNI